MGRGGAAMRCRRMLFLVMLFSISFLNINCALCQREVKQTMVLEKEAIDIGNKEAARLGYNISDMRVDVDEKNTKWNEHIKSGPVLEWNPDIRDKLKNKEYWAIFYGPIKKQLGGDIVIFVDKVNGEVIAVIQGE